MASDNPDTAIDHALARRKHLQDTIRDAMRELNEIESWLKMYRRFSAMPEPSVPFVSTRLDRTLSVAGVGQSQAIFETIVRELLQEHRRPMRADEIVEALALKGTPLQGNATRTAWNRLWVAKKQGVFVHTPLGYWLADEPIPDNPASEPFKRTISPRGQTKRNPQGPRGRRKALSDEQVKQAEQWVLNGKKMKDVARDLGGISLASLSNYFPGGKKGIKAKYAEIAEQEKQDRTESD